MSDSVRPHRRQPTRLLCPRNSPGKNTGVGCHCLLQCIKVKSESEVAQSYLTLSDPMDCSLPGFSVHGISLIFEMIFHYRFLQDTEYSSLCYMDLGRLSILYIYSSVYFGEGKGNPLQYSCLENPMDGGAWWVAVHGVAKSWI